MQIAYSWLSDYLPRPVSVEELSKILTSIGLEVEAVEKWESVPGNLEGLVVGQVVTCIPHPDADKLKLTTVDIGNGIVLPIVCGAPNVAAGQKVVVATVGTTVHPLAGAPFQIKKAKIRGAVSEGMICAEDEIGLGKSHEGILVLPGHVDAGTPARDYFQLPAPDYTFHIGLTPNRSDANSHIGVAIDVCAYLSHHTGTLHTPLYPNEDPVIQEETRLPLSVTIAEGAACSRYAGITLDKVHVAPAPEWLQRRLQSIGVRPVNNIVDITNYVLHEYGQPLHAFDYDKIAGHQIRVQYPSNGQKFTTLDDKERILRQEDLMICDAEQPLCIAGVFGGTGSGITPETQRIFLESAYFTPKSIRRTSLHHGLRTDAATHFEKGVDMERVLPALKRAVQLIGEIAGGVPAASLIDLYPQPLEPKRVTLTYQYINELCGKIYPPASVKALLKGLGFNVITEQEQALTLSVPSAKTDVSQPADIVEEILRIDGLDNVPIPDRLSLSMNRRPASSSRKVKERIALLLTGTGLQEIVTNSITNSKYYPEDTRLVRMINNLSSELDILRPELLESGLEVIAYNANRKIQDIKIYEIGNVYHQEATGKYEQRAKLGIWISGHIQPAHWQHPALPADIYYLKGLLQHLFSAFGLKKLQEKENKDTLEWKRGQQTIASARLVPSDKQKAFDIRQEVYYAELDIAHFTEAIRNNSVKYTELPKFPSMKRDLALVLDKGVPYSKVAAIAQAQKWEALKNYDLFDVFESEKIGKDKKSLALSFTFQGKERTLTDQEVDAMMQQLINAFQKDLQAIIRE